MPCGCALLVYAGLPFLYDGLARTVTIEYERWANQSRGLHRVERWSVRGRAAIRSDGSRANVVVARSFVYHVIPDGRWSYRSIYLKPQNVGYEASDDEKLIQGGECGCTWTRPLLRRDRQCEPMGVEGAKRLSDARVANVPVVRFAYEDEDGWHEIALAPDYGCDVLEYSNRTYNSFGLPTSGERFRVIEYVPGEPKAELFEFPTGYRWDVR